MCIGLLRLGVVVDPRYGRLVEDVRADVDVAVA